MLAITNYNAKPNTNLNPNAASAVFFQGNAFRRSAKLRVLVHGLAQSYSKTYRTHTFALCTGDKRRAISFFSFHSAPFFRTPLLFLPFTNSHALKS